MDTDVLLKRERLVKNIFARLNDFVDLKRTLSTILSELKELTGFEAVSIRLREDDDYPYFVYNGFPDSFIQRENFICPHLNGKHLPECLCGNVISGTVDCSQKYYTLKGSFWTNNIQKDRDSLEKNETQILRLACEDANYLSIGLFPIKTRTENIGLIQLNDKRPDLFIPENVEYLEMIGEQIGVAIENSMLYEKVKDKNEELENTLKELNYAQKQLLEANKMTALADLVTGVAHEVYTPVEKSLSLIQTIINSSGHFNKDIKDAHQNIYNYLNDVSVLVKSFRHIAFDQFQESRHLINLYVFLNDIVRIIKPSIVGKKEIDFKVDCNRHIEIMSFSGILSQVISILLKNSIEHGIDTKGVISIGCSIVDDEFIELSVSDNGRGIDKNIQHKIFEPFFTTEKKSHTGLGLHFAKSLVKNKLKGKLTFVPGFTSGAKFLVQFPA